MAGFRNANGEIQQVPLQVTMYAQAAERGQSFQEYVNNTYPTDAQAYGTTFQQLCASEGIYLKANTELGIRPSTMEAMFNGFDRQAGTVVREGVPSSRILAPAVIMGAIEDKLVADLNMTPAAFDRLVAYDETIDRERYEQPVINMTKPEAGRSQVITQGVEPPTMMTLSLSEKSYKIPTFSLGLEITDEAVKALKIDFVAMSLARQAAIQRNERANGYMLALLNGDLDNNDGSLASLGYSVNASTLDAAATGGTMTQKAWIKYLMRNGTRRRINWIVCDIDSAMAVEGRTGRPTNQTDNPTSPRIDTTFSVANPTWPTNVNLFLSQDTNWPALTMMGIDSTSAIRRVRNLSADYAAIEAYVMKKTKAMRFDFAEHVNRMYPEAFDVLVRA